MHKLCKMIQQVAPSRATVMIYGETGTGKELVAAALHRYSNRSQGPFVKVHCAALAKSLLESELFGHESGAFTGAHGRRQGRFERAHGGTLFLDEVSEIPLDTQVKLLRFLQTRELERVGSNEPVPVDVRIVAATNRDLLAMVRNGRFREDLYYRLNVVQLEVPPLRERPSDIPELVRAFIAKHGQANGLAPMQIADDAMEVLKDYRWPGNVRQLENVVERAVVLADGGCIRRADIMPLSDQGDAQSTDLRALVPGISLAEVERMVVEMTLEALGGNTLKTAQVLGISRRKVQYRIKEWGLHPRRQAETVCEA